MSCYTAHNLPERPVVSTLRKLFRRLFDATPFYPAWMSMVSAVAVLGIVAGLVVFALTLPSLAGLSVPLTSLGILMTAVVVAALQTGRVKVDSSGAEYGGGGVSAAYRDRDPFSFWLSVVFYAALAVCCFGGVVYVLLA